MKNKSLLLLMCCGVFAIFLTLGFSQALNKKMWIDERTSHNRSIESKTYVQILMGKVEEGSTAPLFYILQKLTLGLLNHHPTDEELNNPDSRIILRLDAVVFMSLAIAIIFYYFSYYHSLLVGALSVVISSTSVMVWLYIAEARPYALWFFLTTLQFIFLMNAIRDGKKWWPQLALIHLLLSLTTIFTLVQIVASSLVYWLFIERRWTKFILLLLVPAVVCISYYLCLTERYTYYFNFDPVSLLTAGMPKERILLIGVFLIAWIVAYFKKMGLTNEMLSSHERSSINACLLFVGLMIVGFILILIRFKLTTVTVVENPDRHFEIPNRYFIVLSPISIIAATYLIAMGPRLAVSKRGKVALVGLFLILLSSRLLKFI